MPLVHLYISCPYILKQPMKKVYSGPLTHRLSTFEYPAFLFISTCVHIQMPFSALITSTHSLHISQNVVSVDSCCTTLLMSRMEWKWTLSSVTHSLVPFATFYFKVTPCLPSHPHPVSNTVYLCFCPFNWLNTIILSSTGGMQEPATAGWLFLIHSSLFLPKCLDT